jgi:hypothetical protein
MFVVFMNWKHPAGNVSFPFYMLAMHAYFCKVNRTWSEAIHVVSENLFGTKIYSYTASKNLVSAHFKNPRSANIWSSKSYRAGASFE